MISLLIFNISEAEMSRLAADSAALPVTHVTLRTLRVVNGLYGAAIITLLVAMPTRRWIIEALDLSPSPEAERLIVGLHVIAIVFLAAIPLYDLVLRRLLAIVASVRAGDPFVPANAAHLRTIAWVLLVLQVLSLVVGAIARTVAMPAHPLNIDTGFSINGWLAVLLTFLLARVFATGTLMRDDLEGTV
jgi:hypothetical protein